MSIEKQEHRETQEQMQNRFEAFGELSVDGKRAFTEISGELTVKKGDEKYNENDIEGAISSRFDAMISTKTTNLNEAERAELLMVKSEILSVIKGRSGKEAIEAFALLRSKIYGIIAASDGKSDKKDKNLTGVQDALTQEEMKKGDAFVELKALLARSEARREDLERRKRALLARQAEQAGKEDRRGEQAEAMADLETLRTLA